MDSASLRHIDDFLKATEMKKSVKKFMTESLKIEGINRAPTQDEIEATIIFLARPVLDIDHVLELQAVYAPGKPLRTQPGMNVRIGNYIVPPGGPAIGYRLEELCRWFNGPVASPWWGHIYFEKLHPFIDGNGRTGRTIWAWQMLKLEKDPFALSFLHQYYYQTLEKVDR